MLYNFAYFYFRLYFFSEKLSFQKQTNISNTSRVPNSLNPDLARRYVGPDLGQNNLQGVSEDDSSRQRVKYIAD